MVKIEKYFHKCRGNHFHFFPTNMQKMQGATYWNKLNFIIYLNVDKVFRIDYQFIYLVEIFF